MSNMIYVYIDGLFILMMKTNYDYIYICIILLIKLLFYRNTIKKFIFSQSNNINIFV